MDTTTSLVPSLPDAIVPAHEARSAFLSHLAEWSITQKIRKRGFIYQDVSLEVSGPQFVRVELDSVSDGRQERMPSSVVRLAYVFEFEYLHPGKGEYGIELVMDAETSEPLSWDHYFVAIEE